MAETPQSAPPRQAAPSPARRPLLRAGGEPQASRSTAIRETRPHVRMYGRACATARVRGLPVRGPWAYVSSGKMLIGPVEPGVSLPIPAQAGPRYSGTRWHLACSPYGCRGNRTAPGRKRRQRRAAPTGSRASDAASATRPHAVCRGRDCTRGASVQCQQSTRRVAARARTRASGRPMSTLHSLRPTAARRSSPT